MKIIHCPRRFTTRSWGGTETCLINLAKSQQADGHDVEIMTTRALDPVRDEMIDGIRVRRYDYFYPWLNLTAEEKHQMDLSGGNLFSPGLFKALLAEPDLSLIHAHTGKRLGGIVRTAARLRGIPYVASLHGGVFDVPGSITSDRERVTRNRLEWGRALGAMVGARRVFDDADALFCLSRTEQQALESEYDARVEYLPNGVNTGRFAEGHGERFRQAQGIAADATLLLVMGRIDPQKNQRQLVQLMPRIRRVVKNPVLVFIGHVTDENYLRELQNDISLWGQGDVRIIPGLDHGDQQVVDAYHAADVFCLPSIHEPFGLVILEAWAAGIPVVASAVGGVPDFTRHGIDALLCQNSDDWVQNLALATQPHVSRQLARLGRERATREFDWSVIGRKTTRVYEELVA